MICASSAGSPAIWACSRSPSMARRLGLAPGARRRSVVLLLQVAGHAGLAGGAGPPVEAARAHARDQPGAHGAPGGVEVAGVVPGLQEHVVQHVFGLGAVAQHAQAERQQHRGVAIVKLPQRAAISARDRRTQGDVFGRGHRRRVPPAACGSPCMARQCTSKQKPPGEGSRRR